MKIDLEVLKSTKGVGVTLVDKIINNQKQYDNNLNKTKKEPPKYFKVKKNNIYNGECSDFMRSNIPDESIDLIITSPPYDNIRNYNGYEFDYKEVLSECYRVLKKGGVCVWVVGDSINKFFGETCTSFKQVLYATNCGFILHDTMIYEKNTSSFPSSPELNRYSQMFEYMFVFSKEKPKTANLICDKKNKCYGETNWGKKTQRYKNGELVESKKLNTIPEFSPRGNIWEYVVGGGFSTKDKFAYKHPAIFPEKLVLDHILSWSEEGDLILDPMCGSGTTCKMAKKTNRDFIGIDISEEYTELSKKRVNI